MSLRCEGLWSWGCVSDTLKLAVCTGPNDFSVYRKNLIKCQNSKGKNMLQHGGPSACPVHSQCIPFLLATFLSTSFLVREVRHQDKWWNWKGIIKHCPGGRFLCPFSWKPVIFMLTITTSIKCCGFSPAMWNFSSLMHLAIPRLRLLNRGMVVAVKHCHTCNLTGGLQVPCIGGRARSIGLQAHDIRGCLRARQNLHEWVR